MPEQKSKLKVIRIIDPLLCVRCDHAYIADVVMTNGRRKKMFYCSRLDCDNWLSGNDTAEMEIERHDAA
jgi:hypothetical protein